MTADGLARSFSLPDWCWYPGGALVYLSFGFTEMAGSDLWWHVAAGREMLQQGTIWAADSWAYSATGLTWHNHEWLSDLIFFAWVSLFGIPSLVIWKWLVLVLTFGLLQRLLQKQGGSPAAAFTATVIAALIAAPFLDVRPHLYSLLGTTVLLNLTLGRPAQLRELVPLFVVWVNLHGGFVFGLMLLPFLLFPWEDFSFSRLQRAVWTGFVCLVVCLINPDGVRVFVMPLTYALDSESPFRGIAEWHSPFRAGGITAPAYPYSLVVGASLALAWLLPTLRRLVPYSATTLGIALLTAAMSATSRRFITLWAIAFALLMAPFLAAVFRQRLVQPLSTALLVIGVFWALWRIESYSLRPTVAHHFLTADYTYPHDLVDVMALNRIGGKVFAYYSWGGYLHWRVDGALKVFIDGRANTLYDDQTYTTYVQVLGARPGWVERIEESGARLFMWPHNRRGQRLLRGLRDTGRWRVVYSGVRGTLMAHESVELPSPLRLRDGGFNQNLSIAFVASRSGNQELALNHARLAHEERPWNVDACRWYTTALSRAGQADAAADVAGDCRDWFDSKFLP